MATRAGFVAWIRTNIGASETDLPDDSASITTAYDLSVVLCQGFELATTRTDIVDILTYNLAGHYLYMFGTESVLVAARNKFGLNVVGIVNSASDQGTSGGFALPDWVTKGGPFESELSKTPQGRLYLSVAGQLNSVILVV